MPANEAATTVAIRGTMRAVSVDVKTANGLVGTLKDGDHVDVYAQIGSGNERFVKQGADQRARAARRRSATKDTTAVGDAHILFALSDRDAQKMLWLADNGDDNFWLAQRPQEDALNSPPTVETLQTVLGDGLPAAVQKLIKGLLNPAGATSVSDAIRIFISGSCAGLAEVRQALSSHSAIKVVGTAVDAPSAGDRLREEQVDVLLHGSSRGDRLPTQDIHTLQSASAAPIVIVTSGCTPEFLQEALAHGVQDVAILPQLTESLVFTLRRAHVLNHNAPPPAGRPPRGRPLGRRGPRHHGLLAQGRRRQVDALDRPRRRLLRDRSSAARC